jgi:hypothetical protein
MAENQSTASAAVADIIIAGEKKLGPTVMLLLGLTLISLVVAIGAVGLVYVHGKQVCQALNEARQGHVAWVEAHANAQATTLAGLMETQRQSMIEQKDINESAARERKQMLDTMNAMKTEFYELRKAALTTFREIHPSAPIPKP